MTGAERDLLAVTRALFEPGTAAMVTPILRRRGELPEVWSGRTLRQLQDLLRKGIVQLLSRGGATARVRLDGAGHATEGRAWERMPAPPLHLSLSTLATLRWLVEAELGGQPPKLTVRAEPTLADEIVLSRVVLLLERTRLGRLAHEQPLFAKSPLVWWTALDTMVGAPSPDPQLLARWSTGVGADLLGCLTDPLGLSWASQELRAPRHAAQLHLVGAAREAVLVPLVEGALAAGRPDACGFLLEALQRWIPPESVPFDHVGTPWTKPLDAGASLGARTEARRQSLASLRAIGRLRAAAERARSVGFVDEGWEQAQTMLRWFAPYDEGRFARAAQLLAHIEGLAWEESA